MTVPPPPEDPPPMNIMAIDPTVNKHEREIMNITNCLLLLLASSFGNAMYPITFEAIDKIANTNNKIDVKFIYIVRFEKNLANVFVL